jgi:hypothetical protein
LLSLFLGGTKEIERFLCSFLEKNRKIMSQASN